MNNGNMMENQAADSVPAPEVLDPSASISALATVSEEEDLETSMTLNSKRFLCGLASGVATALLFNPWDKALYLSVIHQNSLFKIDNWRNPFIGSGQSMVIRTISGSMFFPLKEFFDDYIETLDESSQLHLSGGTKSFLSGNMAGVLNGVLLNSINAIKYHTWTEKKGFVGTLTHMYKKGGFQPFARGISATVLRDTIFGGTYAVVRYVANTELEKLNEVYKEKDRSNASLLDKAVFAILAEDNSQHTSFGVSFCAASFGTFLSSPLNYTRNHMYGTRPGEKIPTSMEILRALWKDAVNQNEMNRARYISKRFKLGAAVSRVGCGMAVGQVIYDRTKDFLFPRDEV